MEETINILELSAAIARRVIPFMAQHNIPVTPDQRIFDPLRSQGHTILDLGADEFTVGRLHPMMDFDLRLRRLRREPRETQRQQRDRHDDGECHHAPIDADQGSVRADSRDSGGVDRQQRSLHRAKLAVQIDADGDETSHPGLEGPAEDCRPVAVENTLSLPTPPCARTTAREMEFSSSRTFPGHAYDRRVWIAASLSSRARM